MKLRIKEVIKEKGLTIQALADKMEINRVNLSASINGNPTVETLNKIADALGVEVTELFSTQSQTELTALIEHRNKFYKAETLDELKSIVKRIEQQIS